MVTSKGEEIGMSYPFALLGTPKSLGEFEEALYPRSITIRQSFTFLLTAHLTNKESASPCGKIPEMSQDSDMA